MAFIRRKVKKGRPYYYLVENRRDGPGGSVRQHTIAYIGTEERLKELAMAGWDASQGAPPKEGAAGPASVRSYEHGAPAALWKAAELVGLEGILDECLPPKTVKGMSRGRVLVLGAIHRALDPGSKASFAGWCARTSLPHHLGFDPADLDSQAFWEAMDGVGEDEVDAAQRRIVARLRDLFPGDLDELELDYTNYHTWIDTRNDACVICQRGHSKQKRSDLRLFALAMLTARALPVPLVWEPCEGNRNDKAEFPLFSSKVARELGASLDDVTVSFDGGGNSAEALSSLPFHFVCAHSLAGLKELLDIPLSEYSEVDLGDGHKRLARRVDGLTFSGVEGTGVLTVSEDLRRGQEAELARREARLAKRAEELRERLKNPRSRLFAKPGKAAGEAEQRALAVKGHDSDLERDRAAGKGGGRRRRPKPKAFDEVAAMRGIVEAELFGGAAALRGFWSCEVTRSGEGEEAKWSLSVERDDEARAAHCEREFGKKLTVTDRTDWDTWRILSAYAGQECVEDLSGTTKMTDHFSVRPQFHWTDDKIRMHVFLCLCSVTLAEVLLRKVADRGVTGHTKASLLDALAGVREAWVVAGGSAARVLEELGGEERRLWEAVVDIPGDTLGTR